MLASYTFHFVDFFDVDLEQLLSSLNHWLVIFHCSINKLSRNFDPIRSKHALLCRSMAAMVQVAIATASFALPVTSVDCQS
jgi:hypothetical protein